MVRPVPVGQGMAAAPVAPVGPAGPSAEKAPPPMSVRDQVLAAVAKSAEPGPVPANLTPALNAIAKPEVFVNGCVLSWRDVAQPECVSGDVGSPTTVALVGDSHAAMWQPALEPVAQERHWRLETMSKVLCPFLDLPINSPYLGRKFTECEQWRGSVMARLFKEKPQVIVLDMSRRYGADFGFTSYDQAWLDSLTLVVKTLRRTGAKVLVLSQVPDPHSDGADVCVGAYGQCGRVRAGEGRRVERRRDRGGGRGDGSGRRSVRGAVGAVLHGRPLPGHRREHVGVPRRQPHHDRVRAGARATS